MKYKTLTHTDQRIKNRKMTAQDEKSNAKATTKPDSKPKLGQPSASEDSASPYPNMELCQQIHKLLVKADGSQDGKLQIEVLNRIREELENPTLYGSVEKSLGVTTGIWSAADLAAQNETNLKTVEDLEEKVEDAKESAGDMEVMDARVEVARFAAKSLTEEEALEAYKKLLELPKVSSGKKIDAVMESSRVASFYGNSKKSSESIDTVSNNMYARLFSFIIICQQQRVYFAKIDQTADENSSTIGSFLLNCIFRPKRWLPMGVVETGTVAIDSRFTVVFKDFWNETFKEQLRC